MESRATHGSKSDQILESPQQLDDVVASSIFGHVTLNPTDLDKGG